MNGERELARSTSRTARPHRQFARDSGVPDVSPLVSRLRENDRYVIGRCVESSSSDLLVGQTRDEKSGTCIITSVAEDGARA